MRALHCARALFFYDVMANIPHFLIISKYSLFVTLRNAIRTSLGLRNDCYFLLHTSSPSAVQTQSPTPLHNHPPNTAPVCPYHQSVWGVVVGVTAESQGRVPASIPSNLSYCWTHTAAPGGNIPQNKSKRSSWSRLGWA